MTGWLSALPFSMPRAARVGSQEETEPEGSEKDESEDLACHGSGRGRSGRESPKVAQPRHEIYPPSLSVARGSRVVTRFRREYHSRE